MSTRRLQMSHKLKAIIASTTVMGMTIVPTVAIAGTAQAATGITQTVTITGGTSYSYGDTATFTATATTSPVTFSSTGDCTITSAGAFTASNVGSCVITATAPAGKSKGTDYQSATATSTITIGKKALTAAVSVADKVYDGTTDAAVTATISGTVLGDSVSIPNTGTFASANVGTSIAVAVSNTLSGTNAGNYTLAAISGKTANITAKPLTANFAVTPKTYDGTTAATVTSVTPVGVIGSENVTISGGTATFDNKNIGTNKTVTLSGATLSGSAKSNYTLAASSSVNTGAIAAKLVPVEFTANNKVYDGTTTASIGTITIPAKIASDTLAATGGTAVFSDKNVGVGKTVTLTGVTFTGTDAANYSFQTTTKTANITAKPITVSISAADKTYDRSTAAILMSTTLSGVVGSEAVSLNKGAATFADRNVGTGKTVTLSGYSLSGADASNYSLSNASATNTANITKKALTVSFTAASKAYDGTTAATISRTSLVGVISPDSVSVNNAGTATFSSKDAGLGKTVTLTGVTLAGTDASNYSYSNSTDTADITGKELTVTYSASNKTYDGSTSASITRTSLTGVLLGETVTITATGTFDSANIGANKPVTIAASVTSANRENYYLAPFTMPKADVTAKQLSAIFTASDKVYDASTSATVSGSLTGVVAGDDVTVTGTGTFADKNVGINKSVVISEGTLQGAAAGNYTLDSAIASPKAAITKATLTPSFTVTSKEYDKATSATYTGLQLAGILGSDVVSVSAGSATFDSAAAGDNKTVTLSGLALSGADAGNYQLSATSTTALGVITKKALTASFTITTRDYDGGTDASIAGITLNGVISRDQVSGAGGTAAFKDKNVGTGKFVTVAAVTLSGADADNYTVTSNAASGTITAKPLVGAFTATNKEYDGTREAELNGSLTGKVDGDVLTLKGSGTFASAAIGTNKTVSITGASLVGRDASNYTLGSSNSSTTASITAREVTATWVATTKVYDGTNAAAVIGTVTNTVGSENVTVSGTGTFEDADAGENKNVAITDITLGGTARSNYVLGATTASTTGTITPLEITPQISVNPMVYNSQDTAPVTTTLPGLLSADAGNVNAPRSGKLDSANAGLRQVMVTCELTGAKAKNYKLMCLDLTAGSQSAKVAAIVVTPAEQSVDVDPITDQVYSSSHLALKGKSSSNLNVHYASTDSSVCEVQEDDSVALIGEGDCTIEATQPGNGNYKAADKKSVTFKVAKATPNTNWDDVASEEIAYGTALGDRAKPTADVDGGTFSKPRTTVRGVENVEVDETTTLAPGEYTVETTFTPDEANGKKYRSVTKSRTITVADYDYDAAHGYGNGRPVITSGLAVATPTDHGQNVKINVSWTWPAAKGTHNSDDWYRVRVFKSKAEARALIDNNGYSGLDTPGTTLMECDRQVWPAAMYDSKDAMPADAPEQTCSGDIFVNDSKPHTYFAVVNVYHRIWHEQTRDGHKYVSQMRGGQPSDPYALTADGPTNTSLVSNPDPSLYTHNATFTATVKAMEVDTDFPLTGDVRISAVGKYNAKDDFVEYDTPVVIDTCTLGTSESTTDGGVTVETASCSVSTDALTPGKHVLEARYLGTESHRKSYATDIHVVTKEVIYLIPSNKSVVYGSNAAGVTYSYKLYNNAAGTGTPLTDPAGFVEPICSSSYSATKAVGTYTDDISCTGASATVYGIDEGAKGTLTITKHDLEVTADITGWTYGASANDPRGVPGTDQLQGDDALVQADTEYSYSGTGSTTYGPSSAAPTQAGTYEVIPMVVTVKRNSIDATGNYDITYVKDSFTIAKASLVVTANSASMMVGDTPPAMTYTVTGWMPLLGRAAQGTFTDPVCTSSTAVSASFAVGTYPIVCAGGASTNYSFRYVNGVMTITTAPVTPSAASPTPTPTPTVSASPTSSASPTPTASLTTTSDALTVGTPKPSASKTADQPEERTAPLATPTASPVPTVAPRNAELLPFQDPGKAAALVNGKLVTMEVLIENGKVSLSDPSGMQIDMQVFAGDGMVVVPDANGRISVHSNMEITMQGSGFKPRSSVTVLLLPGTTVMGTAKTGDDGTFKGVFLLPRSLKTGGYNVKMEGLDKNGAARQLAFGLEVVPDNVPLNLMRPASSLNMASINGVGVFGVFGLIMLLWWIIAKRRMKDEHEYVNHFKMAE